MVSCRRGKKPAPKKLLELPVYPLERFNDFEHFDIICCSGKLAPLRLRQASAANKALFFLADTTRIMRGFDSIEQKYRQHEKKSAKRQNYSNRRLKPGSFSTRFSRYRHGRLPTPYSRTTLNISIRLLRRGPVILSSAEGSRPVPHWNWKFAALLATVARSMPSSRILPECVVQKNSSHSTPTSKT